MIRHKCTLCGYIYDPSKGDSEGGIEAGTSFENLPEDWTCPLCRIGKDKFIEIEITESGGCYETSIENQQIAPKNDTRIDDIANNHDYDNHSNNSNCKE